MVVGFLSMKIVVSSRFVEAIVVDSMSVALAAEGDGHKQGQMLKSLKFGCKRLWLVAC